MNTRPGVAAMDTKLFVSRLNDPWPDLYELYWNSVEWIWVNHGRPGGARMRGAPGCVLANQKLFVVTEDGKLWERIWAPNLGRWVWNDHGRPDNRHIAYGPAAPMLNKKFFVVTDDGNLRERNWSNGLGRWVWEDHGRPGNQRIVADPGAAMLDRKLFVTTETGNLWERIWSDNLGRWVWQDHGRPGNQRVVTAPGAAMLNKKLFVATDQGNLWERNWVDAHGQWVWVDHGRPGNERIVTAPGAAILDKKLFVTTDRGNLWERNWADALGTWVWTPHGSPDNTKLDSAPCGVMMDSKLFVGAQNDHLYERHWSETGWTWIDHGTPFHDQGAHVIGTPGAEPKLTIAVMGDGYTEQDMNHYRSHVQNVVVRAFNLDQLGQDINALRVIRIDVVSSNSGVAERTYDDQGTPTPNDDTVIAETYRASRLGFISTGSWDHCWIEKSPHTNERISSILQRFAPDATNIIVVVNSTLNGGCNRSNIAVFTERESAEVIAHELGHNLFDLGDEYSHLGGNFTDVARVVNLTEKPPTWNDLKWRGLVANGTPLPTAANSPPRGWNNNTSVGAFEGGGGHYATGIFRPVIQCRMNQNNPPWCPVCGREIRRILREFI